MTRFERGIVGMLTPRRLLRFRSLDTWQQEGRCNLTGNRRAVRLGIRHFRRNEGPIGRELEPRVDMNYPQLGSGFVVYSNAWSALNRTMVNPRGSTASSLFFTVSRKTYVTLAVQRSRFSSV